MSLFGGKGCYGERVVVVAKKIRGGGKYGDTCCDRVVCDGDWENDLAERNIVGKGWWQMCRVSKRWKK